MTERRIRDILTELVDENPLAVRGVLRIVDVEFSDVAPTLGVTCEEKPRLLINLGFVQKNCKTDAHVKAVLLHEFLHVLLGHTGRPRRATLWENLAFDAVINAIIHRSFGPQYSSMMSEYYGKTEGPARLLRPHRPDDFPDLNEIAYEAACSGSVPSTVTSPWLKAWLGLYRGRIVADDILDLARDLSNRAGENAAGTHDGHRADGDEERSGNGGDGAEQRRTDDEASVLPEGTVLLGNHEDGPPETPPALAEAVSDALKQMDGSNIWRRPVTRGASAEAVPTVFMARDVRLDGWKRATMRALRDCLIPDRHRGMAELEAVACTLPVVSPSDKRAFVRAQWGPLVPEFVWLSERELPVGRANVYLDVSGSMTSDMPYIVALLNLLRRAIRMPFWAFSTEVAPAIIKDGQLHAGTTGGTSIACVLAHVRQTRPEAALIVTDGYIEKVCPSSLAGLEKTRLRALVTGGGSPCELARAGIPYVQLEAFPGG